MKIVMILCLVLVMVSGVLSQLPACNQRESSAMGCRNGGTCVYLQLSRRLYYCDCTPQYEGNKCERPKPGHCPPGTKTDDHIRQNTNVGRCCVLPFEYRGTTYSSCTARDHRGVLWCSFNIHHQPGQWAHCACSDTEAGTHDCNDRGVCVKKGDGSLTCSCHYPWGGDHCERQHLPSLFWGDKK